ncbi:DUF2306 domain-containing protein [Tropicimonas sp. IMCC6043]|uniref:DUF2306 domain-containing protein n=1 Tax=Tropicimonas sp. IMCC6043 TaxID=2510645 RepID=UPI00101CE543|nr:DUF2306 domain-containing protein [Tropicimonas sp. IMCC6043]RYH11344.1 DUF2306 domain-containing protein [Tropicimonas sp. IMCC6043]
MAGRASRRSWRWEAAQAGSLLLMYLMISPFLVHSVEIVAAGLGGEPAGKPYLFVQADLFGNSAMVVHATAGVILTALVPLQLVGVVRRNMTMLHRAMGVLLLGCTLFASVGGLAYIAIRGTVGGPVMSIGFALYGLCLLFAAARLFQTAMEGDRPGHWRWSLRFFWLAIGSWLYRLHYVLWYLATGGIWSTPDFTGAFDRVQNFAFYIPYLFLVQVWIARRAQFRTCPPDAATEALPQP